jgi:hypothetical protein
MNTRLSITNTQGLTSIPLNILTQKPTLRHWNQPKTTQKSSKICSLLWRLWLMGKGDEQTLHHSPRQSGLSENCLLQENYVAFSDLEDLYTFERMKCDSWSWWTPKHRPLPPVYLRWVHNLLTKHGTWLLQLKPNKSGRINFSMKATMCALVTGATLGANITVNLQVTSYNLVHCSVFLSNSIFYTWILWALLFLLLV